MKAIWVILRKGVFGVISTNITFAKLNYQFKNTSIAPKYIYLYLFSFLEHSITKNDFDTESEEIFFIKCQLLYLKCTHRRLIMVCFNTLSIISDSFKNDLYSLALWQIKETWKLSKATWSTKNIINIYIYTKMFLWNAKQNMKTFNSTMKH